MPRAVLLMISSMRGGGSEQQTLLLLRHLDRSRVTPHLYLIDRVGPLLRQVPDDVVVHAFSDVAAPDRWYFPGRIHSQQVADVRRVIATHAIDVIYDRTYHMSLIAGPAARHRDVPRVSTIVSPPELALPLGQTRFLAIKRRRLKSAYRESQAVVAVSQRAAASAARYYQLPADSIEVIANPVDVQQLVADSRAIPPPPRQAAITLVCVARMTVEKGHRDLLDALAATERQWPAGLPPLQLWLVGDGPLRGELESQWRSIRCRHAVSFLGHWDNPAPAIAAADALVLPSRFEGMPNVVLEAMALNTPVIATRAGGTVELERDEPTILWSQPSMPQSLAEAIIRFVSDREQADRRVAAAGRLISRDHDVETATRRIEALLCQDSRR